LFDAGEEVGGGDVIGGAGAEVFAEEVGSGEFGGGVEALEDESVVFEGGGIEEASLENTEDEGVKEVGGGREG
jgi:hypothetical protein